MTKRRTIPSAIRAILNDIGDEEVRAKLNWAMNAGGLADQDKLEDLGGGVSAPRWAIEQWLTEKTVRRRIFVTAGIATSIAIALLAATFTGLQWRETHNQLQETRNQLLLSLKPHVDFDTEDDLDTPPAGVAIMNEGPGPASIKSFKYFVDRKQVKNLFEAAANGKINPDQMDYVELDPGDVIAVQEKDWLVKYHKLRGGKANSKDADRFADFIDNHFAIEVEFCSVVDGSSCWTKCSTKDRC